MAGKRHCKSFTKVNRKRKRVSVYVFASILRKRMTKAEKKLEQQLRLKLKEWVFESQAVVAGRFIADMLCRKSMLIIECDGGIHSLRRVKKKDEYRTGVLSRLGYTVVRFTNREVLTNCDKVIAVIKSYL